MTTKLAKKHRAQLRWHSGIKALPELSCLSVKQTTLHKPTLVYVLPATPEAYEAQVEAMAYALWKDRWLIDRIVDCQDIPWAIKTELLAPHFPESTLRRHYGAENAAKEADNG